MKKDRILNVILSFLFLTLFYGLPFLFATTFFWWVIGITGTALLVISGIILFFILLDGSSPRPFWNYPLLGILIILGIILLVISLPHV